jgi:hypothetical protein
MSWSQYPLLVPISFWLIDLFSLSNYWGLEELNQLVQAKIIGNKQISPATYEEGEL